MILVDLDRRRKKILFQSQRRGMHENDILVGGFVRARIAQLDERQLADLEDLLEVNDVDLFRWITNRAPVPEQFQRPILFMIRDFNDIS